MPLPLEPKLNWPGFALISAISSATVFAFTLGDTTSTLVALATCATGVKSVCALYGIFGFRLGPIECVELVAIWIV